jgi:hypothetical protein
MDRPHRRADIVIQQIGRETVLQDRDRQQVHVVNRTAAWIWERLDGTRASEEIATEMAEQFEVTVDRARRDVVEIIRSFGKLGLLA